MIQFGMMLLFVCRLTTAANAATFTVGNNRVFNFSLSATVSISNLTVVNVRKWQSDSNACVV
jgi:hypothetical protein